MVKTLLTFILLASHANFCFGQLPYFEVGDIFTVIAKSGANLRDSARADSKKIITIPFGEKVISKSLYQGYGNFDERQGGWIKVRYNGKEGYIFTGFITHLKIPSLNVNQLDCGYLSWFENIFQENVDSLICSGTKEYKGFDGDGKDWSVAEWKIYNNETEIYYYSGYESRSLIVESRTINMNDILIFWIITLIKLVQIAQSYMVIKMRIDPK